MLYSDTITPPLFIPEFFFWEAGAELCSAAVDADFFQDAALLKLGILSGIIPVLSRKPRIYGQSQGGDSEIKGGKKAG